jgi:hypothetical protein
MRINSSNSAYVSTKTPSVGAATTANRTEGVKDDEAGLRTKLIFWRVKRRLGRIPLSSRIQARDLKLLRLSSELSGHIAGPGKVSPKLKEIAQLKVAVMVGCPL